MARTIESCGDFADFFSLFNAFTTTSHVEAVKASADDYLSKGCTHYNRIPPRENRVRQT